MRYEEKGGGGEETVTDRIAARRSRTRSRDRLLKKERTVESSIEVTREYSRTTSSREVHVEVKSDIRSTRIDDILKSASLPAVGSRSPRSPVTSPPPETEEDGPPPPPPARTESRDIKQILAERRSRPRRPFNDPDRNGVKSPDPRKATSRAVLSPSPTPPDQAPPTITPQAAPQVKADPPKPAPEEELGESILEKLRKRKERLLNNNKPVQAVPDSPVARKPPGTPQDDLEKQALDSLQGLTATIVKERDSARGERNEARQRCIHILKDYDGRKQAWQNQLNVVKIRLEHYARRHDKFRSDILKQREQFDIERTRMKERHANQIEGLFGDLFSKIKTDNAYVGSSTGLDEVNYKLEAFMELWKSLAHDVDDLYDKEHYCSRMNDQVKSLEDQIKHQNKIIADILKGQPATMPAPPRNDINHTSHEINLTIDSRHEWEMTGTTNLRDEANLPIFDELKKLGSLLPAEDGLSCEDILSQFAPIEETFDTLDMKLTRKPRKEMATSPGPPIVVEVRDIPCVNQRPDMPKPSININRTIRDYDIKPELPIEMDPEKLRRGPTVEADAAPRETTIDDPAPEPEKKKKKRRKKVEPAPEPPVIQMEVAHMVEEEPPMPPSPTPSFRRRRASMESAKDFSILGDPDWDEPLSPPPLPIATPKETTLDDPAQPEPPAPAPEKKKKKWTPSVPIFNKKLPKMEPPPVVPPREPEPEPVPSSPSEQEEDTGESSQPTTSEAPEPTNNMKRAKSLPRFRDPSLPRNMAGGNMARSRSNPRLKKDPGSECESDSDSDIRSLIESVYMPLHLTPSRSGSKRNIADDAKSEASSFARRNKMPGSMGWLDSNKPHSSDESSSEDGSSESDSDSDSSNSDSESDEEDGGEPQENGVDTSSSESDEEAAPIGNLAVEDEMLNSILRDFDNQSKDLLSSSFASSRQPGEILI